MAVGAASNHVATDVRIVLVRKEDEHSWPLVPAVCARIARFCRQYHSDADQEEIVTVYQHNFMMPDPKIIAIVALDNDRLIAHLLISLDQWMGEKVATILQYEQEEDAQIPPEILQRTFAWVRNWAAEHGASHLQCLVRHPKLSKAFATHYGFHPFALIMRQPVKEA